ncbi:MAG: hypothetical protein E7058_10730 [Lentisphaerae bacterium]|nr:hypothetical protein [Lentisphaerota bacterium]
MNKNFEHWVWTELLAFDCQKPDCGAAEYIETLGFAPKGVCLLLTTLDFAFAHTGMEKEFILPPDHCSRNGHPANEVRTRQEWTNYNLRTLIRELQKFGCEVYYSSFSTAMLDKFHKEWVSDHPEVRGVYSWYDGDPEGRGNDVCLIKNLADGTPVAEVFAEKLVKCCKDYGFDGFHGADGCGPWWASGTETDMSDPFLAGFLKDEWNAPDFVKAPWDGDLNTYIRRSEWVWANHRLEWINYLTGKWADAWKTITDALHAANLKSVINSANTRGAFDAMYETGINYKLMAQTGIDAMVVETVALGVEMGDETAHPHDDYPAVLREIRTFAPEFKLIFLHGIKDVVENWDNLRHAPCAYERELCRLANSYYFNGETMERAASGLLGCLADGIKSAEWEFICSLWKTHISRIPVAAGEVTTLHCDEQLLDGLADYTADGMPSSHDMIRSLMEHGIAIETAAQLKHANKIAGVKLIASAHLADPDEIGKLIASGTPLILMGRAGALEKYFHSAEVVTDSRIALAAINCGDPGTIHRVDAGGKWVESPVKVRFCQYRNRMDIREEFWQLAAGVIRNAARNDADKRQIPFAQITNDPRCTLQQQLLDEKTLRITVENRAGWRRLTAALKFNLPIANVRIITSFPLRPAGSDSVGWNATGVGKGATTFTVPVPPRGVTVIEVVF